MNLVGGLVTGAFETPLLDKGLQQQRTVTVASLPIVGKPADSCAQDLGSEIFRLDPGQNEKAGVVDETMQVLLALPVAPADEAITRRALPGGGAKAQEGEQVIPGTDPIAQLRAREGLVAEVVVTLDVFIPAARVPAGFDQA